jgi:hypothetical protein
MKVSIDLARDAPGNSLTIAIPGRFSVGADRGLELRSLAEDKTDLRIKRRNLARFGYRAFGHFAFFVDQQGNLNRPLLILEERNSRIIIRIEQANQRSRGPRLDIGLKFRRDIPISTKVGSAGRHAFHQLRHLRQNERLIHLLPHNAEARCRSQRGSLWAS